jgi:hypothetical protein
MRYFGQTDYCDYGDLSVTPLDLRLLHESYKGHGQDKY